MANFQNRIRAPNQGTASKHGIIDVGKLPEYGESDFNENARREPPPFMPIPFDFPEADLPETDLSAPSVMSGSSGVTEETLEAPTRAVPFVDDPALTRAFPAVDHNGAIPPDVHGAIGRDHLMAVHNGTVCIQGFGGTVLRMVSLDAFWGQVAGEGGTFDPKVLYDAFSEHWVVTACDDARLPTSAVLIAVSDTADPLGRWHTWRVQLNAADNAWADYPSIGINERWIVVQVNVYTTGDAFARSHVYVFDKADLLAGGAGRFELLSLVGEGATQAPAVIQGTVGVFRNMYLLQAGNSNLGERGYLRLYHLSGDFGSLTMRRQFVSIANTWDSRAPNGADFAPQRGLPERIQVNDSRIHNVILSRPQAVGGQTALYAAHTILLPAGGAAIS